MFENAAPVWGTYLNNVFDLVDVKYQTNQAGDVFENARSDQAKNARGDWSDPKTLFVFVIHKHKFVICVCVAHFFCSKINFVSRHKSHSRLKKNLYWIHK